MPLTLTTPCKTCGTGRPWPADARFCRTCGRAARWSETAAGRRRIAAAVAVAVVLLVALVGLAVLLATTARRAMAVPARVVPAPPAVVRPVPIPPVPPAARPLPPATPSADRPAATPDVPATPDAVIDPPVVPSVPARAGDTDLTALPLSAYAGGPSADRLTVRGLRLGLPLSAVPVAMLDESAPDHLRDTAGNLYAVDGNRISEVHVHDPDLLARWPIDSTADLVGHFGRPADVYTGDGNDAFPTYRYPDRGIHVRWDNAAGRIIELVLVAPAPPPVPARPGDTDLAAVPLAAYAGGPPGDRLTIRGIGVGVSGSAVPDALLAERTPGHLRDVGGNVYDLTDGRVTRVHVREAAVLDRMPIDGTHALLARFGDPDRPPQDVGAQMFVVAYEQRGVDVRWDDGVQHLDEVTLSAPRPAR